MQNYHIWRLLSAFGVTICFASSVLATQTTSMQLTGVAGLAPGSLGGVYTSPYLGTIGGIETNVKIICDDFASETYFNETWTAYETNLSTIPSNLLRWSSGYAWDGTKWVQSLDQSTAYTVAAYLATKILEASDFTTQADYSYALWGLFDAGDLNGGPFSGKHISGNDLSAAQNLLRQAESAVQNQHLGRSDYANVTIYSYDSPDSIAAGQPTCPSGSCPPPPQEFIRVSMAEPSYPDVLAIDLLAVAGLMVGFRRRLTNIFS